MTGIRGSGRSGMIRGFAVVLVALPLAGQAASMGTWETTLQGRDLTGDGLADAYYDTVLNITWLANANLAASNTFDVTGINANGTMNWATANAWIDAMNTANYLGYNDWRLPTLSPINGTSFQASFSNNATTDYGYADADGWVDASGTPVAEMGHMYYVNLGNLGRCTSNDASPGSCLEQTGWGLSNIGPFTNLQSNYYWSGVEFVSSFGSATAWRFFFNSGIQDWGAQDSGLFAWAVLDGDVTPVPLPAAGWLFLSALAGLGGLAWRRKQAGEEIVG